MLPGGRAALHLASWLALLVPLALLGGAYIGQYAFGLYPCEMCWWQRYPHFVALALGLAAVVRMPARGLVLAAALAIGVSGLIGAFHAGVEYGWWQGLTDCATAVKFGGGDPLDAIMKAPVVRCDSAPWTLLGISLAGFNFLISGGAAVLIIALLRRARSVR